MATSFTLRTSPSSTAHQALGAASITLQLPTASLSGFLLPSTAKDAPRPPLTLDWNVGLPSATFVKPETHQKHSRRLCIVYREIKIARRMVSRKHLRSREQEEKANSKQHMRSYIARYPVRVTVQSAFHSTPRKICSFKNRTRLLWETFNLAVITVRILFFHISTNICSQVGTHF